MVISEWDKNIQKLTVLNTRSAGKVGRVIVGDKRYNIMKSLGKLVARLIHVDCLLGTTQDHWRTQPREA